MGSTLAADILLAITIFKRYHSDTLQERLPGDLATFLLWHGYRDDVPNVWELFAGTHGWTDACARRGWGTLRPIELLDDPRLELLAMPLLRMVVAILRAGLVLLLHRDPTLLLNV